MGELHYRLARLDEAERVLEEAVAEAERIQDATCLAYADALLQRVQILTAESTNAVSPPAAVADLPREVAAVVQLAALEWELRQEDSAPALPGCLRRAADAARAVAATDPNATVRNAAVEGLCAVLEAGWGTRDVGLAGEAAEQLGRHADLAADATLREYARWLVSTCRAGAGRHGVGLAGLGGSRTVFALRAERLLAAHGDWQTSGPRPGPWREPTPGRGRR